MDPKLKELLDAIEQKLSALGSVKLSEEDLKKAHGDIASLLEKYNGTAVEVQRLTTQVAELRAMLKANLGKSGADDWRETFGKWLCGCFHHRATGRVPDELRVSGYEYDNTTLGKAYTVGTGATAGYLVPTMLLTEIQRLRTVTGKIMPNLTKLTIPALSKMTVNSDNVLPTVGYVAEGVSMGEVTGANFATGTLSPKLIGGYITAQNELLNYPGIGFADQMAIRFMEAIVDTEETGVVGGTVAGGYPHEGIISTTNVNAQTALATATVQNILTYIGECCADHKFAEKTEFNKIILSPERYFALAGQAVGTNVGAALAWADPKAGIPPRLFGYEVIMHSGALVSTTHSVVLGDLRQIIFGHSGEIAVDFNPYATGTNLGWSANQTLMRVMTHSDWVVGAPKAWHKATITA